jgi:heat shock protein HtpX
MSSLGNHFKTVMLLALLTALMLWAGDALGGRQGLYIALVIVLAMNFFTYWFSDKLVLKMYRAQPVKKSEYPELYNVVKEIAHKAKIPVPKLHIIKTETPNAFATGRNPGNSAVACTTGLLDLLDKNELRGVIAHEIGHIKNRDTLIQVVAATIAGVISYLAFFARFAVIFGGRGGDRDGGGLELLALAILTPIIAAIIQLAISRSREYIADATAANTLMNSRGLASALEKLDAGVKRHPLRFGSPQTSSIFITNPFSVHGLSVLFSTHPPIEERVKKLKNMDF